MNLSSECHLVLILLSYPLLTLSIFLDSMHLPPFSKNSPRHSGIGWGAVPFPGFSLGGFVWLQSLWYCGRKFRSHWFSPYLPTKMFHHHSNWELLESYRWVQNLLPWEWFREIVINWQSTTTLITSIFGQHKITMAEKMLWDNDSLLQLHLPLPKWGQCIWCPHQLPLQLMWRLFLAESAFRRWPYVFLLLVSTQLSKLKILWHINMSQ